MPPWQVGSDRTPTRWERMVWRFRRDYYTEQLMKKRRRDAERLERQSLGNG